MQLTIERPMRNEKLCVCCEQPVARYLRVIPNLSWEEIDFSKWVFCFVINCSKLLNGFSNLSFDMYRQWYSLSCWSSGTSVIYSPSSLLTNIACLLNLLFCLYFSFSKRRLVCLQCIYAKLNNTKRRLLRKKSCH